MFLLRRRRGMSLIEIIVAIGIFLLFAGGVYAGISFIFKVVYQSRLRIVEMGILNEEMEIIRNIAYEHVGTVGGSPSGILNHTATTTRNGMIFNITRTVRNIDDTYDGTIGGTPNDTTPADYKLVQLEVICATCDQRTPAKITSHVAPKHLEGDPTRGALFIRVFNATAQPVQGASVHVVATTTNPAIDLVDTTDNAGYLRLLDLGAGAGAYHITITKDGYTSDGTLASSALVPNPVKPPASVIAQSVTSISFSIDLASTVTLTTANALCSVVSTVPVNVLGTQRIGTDPDVFLINQNITTNGSGAYTLTNIPGDSYLFEPSNYNLIGSIPQLPLALAPGSTQPVQLILGANSTYSLLVNVYDNATNQPISNATVTVTSTGYTGSGLTGVGFIRQTDWSGGSGQTLFEVANRYWTETGLETASAPGDIKLRLVGSDYVSSGELESSIIDFGSPVSFVNLLWEPLGQPGATGVSSTRWQIATSNSTTTPTWNYLGPDGTSGTFYDQLTPAVGAEHAGKQYLRYKLFLGTETATSTPTISDVMVTYTNSCTPPGQVYFGSLSNQEYFVTVERSGYQTKTERITVDGDVLLGVGLVTQ